MALPAEHLRPDRRLPEESNVASVGFSLFNMSSQFVTVMGVLFSTLLSIRFGKKAVAIVGFSLTTIFMALFILLPPRRHRHDRSSWSRRARSATRRPFR